jgi:hypothetical protein
MVGNYRYCLKVCVNKELISCHFKHTVTNFLELSYGQLNNAHDYVTRGHDPLKNCRL